MVSPVKSKITNVPPSFYAKQSQDPQVWLQTKRVDDDVEDDLWRIHNTLYDLSDFIDKHPGGADWLKWTKGHDITEPFIAHHLAMKKTEPYLKKYRVRETTKPRNVKLTFNENGFYMTLRKRVISKLPEILANTKVYSKIYLDVLFVLTILTCIFAQRLQSIWIGCLAGLFMTCTGIGGHNFIHQRDNFRMWYFNLTLMSYRDWRIAHVLSHHFFPNSLLDVELVSHQPYLCYIPDKNVKNFVQRYVSYVYAPLFYITYYPREFFTKVFLSITQGHKMYIDEFLPFIFPVIMYSFGGEHSFVSALRMFVIIVLGAGMAYGIIAVNAGHHHPDILHDGDPIRKDHDWGLYTIDCIMDRSEMRGRPFLALVGFGDHALHHLFPTLDHFILPKLYDIFFETLLEFQAECQCYPWFFETMKGLLLQASRVEPMKLDPHERFMLKLNKPKQSSLQRG